MIILIFLIMFKIYCRTVKMYTEQYKEIERLRNIIRNYEKPPNIIYQKEKTVGNSLFYANAK